MNRNAVKRLLAVALCAFMALSLIFSCAFIITHTTHDCAGEDCLVCLQLERSARVLRGFGVLLLIVYLFSASCRKPILRVARALYIPVRVTPVSLKDKLLD